MRNPNISMPLEQESLDPRHKSFMVGARKAFMWATAAGFISGCAPALPQKINGVSLEQATKVSQMKEKIQRPDASLREDVKSIREKTPDSVEVIRDQEAQIGFVEARSMQITKDGKTKALLNIQTTLEPSYVQRKPSRENLYVVVYDPDNQSSSQDGFAVVNTYSLAGLNGANATKGKIEVNQLIEPKSGVRVLLTSSSDFQDSLGRLVDSSKISQIDTLIDTDRSSSSRGMRVRDSQSFSGLLDSSVLKNDITTVLFDYVDPASTKLSKSGLIEREKGKFDEDSIGGLVVEGAK